MCLGRTGGIKWAMLLCSGGSRISQRECANLLFGKVFAENCMKVNELDWVCVHPLGPPMTGNVVPPQGYIFDLHPRVS